jgi:hypothetical protein
VRSTNRFITTNITACEKHDALHQGIIPFQHRLHRQPADARPGEHGFGDDRAVQQSGYLQPMMVMVGISEFFSTCLKSTTRSLSPLARAVRT